MQIEPNGVCCMHDVNHPFHESRAHWPICHFIVSSMKSLGSARKKNIIFSNEKSIQDHTVYLWSNLLSHFEHIGNFRFTLSTSLPHPESQMQYTKQLDCHANGHGILVDFPKIHQKILPFELNYAVQFN